LPSTTPTISAATPAMMENMFGSIEIFCFEKVHNLKNHLINRQ